MLASRVTITGAGERFAAIGWAVDEGVRSQEDGRCQLLRGRRYDVDYGRIFSLVVGETRVIVVRAGLEIWQE